MNRPKLTDEAEADLGGIWVRIARDSPANATRFINRVLERCERLADMPGTGRPRADLGPDLRSVALGNYLIFYRPIEGGIEVVRVLHGRRNIAALFGGRAWAGQLVGAVVILGGVFGGAWFFMKSLTNSWRKATVAKYERRKQEQKARFGRDVKQAAREGRAQ